MIRSKLRLAKRTRAGKLPPVQEKPKDKIDSAVANKRLLESAAKNIRMLLANAPVVLFGDAIAKRLPLKIVRAVAALLFLALGLAAFFMPSAP